MFPFDDVIMEIKHQVNLTLNPLHAKFFRGHIKHIFTFHVIPLHWFNTGGWNPSSNKTRTYPFYIANIMAAGVLATQGARTSAAMILTFNMLNGFKDHRRYIHILNHIFNLAWPKLMKLTMKQQCIWSVLHSQYYACWCTGNFRSQCISKHGIDPQTWNIPFPATLLLQHIQYNEAST